MGNGSLALEMFMEVKHDPAWFGMIKYVNRGRCVCPAGYHTNMASDLIHDEYTYQNSSRKFPFMWYLIIRPQSP